MKYLTEQLQQTLDSLAATGAATLRTVARESPDGAKTVAAAADGSNLEFAPGGADAPALPIGSGGRSISLDPQLTPREIMALETYTGTGSPEVNRALREGRGLDFQHDIADLRSALHKIPDYEGTVYRHIDVPEEMLPQYKKGAVFTELGFMSTSTRPYALKKGNVHIALASFSGKPIKQWSVDPDEEEVLFLDGTSSRLHSRFDRIEQGRLHSYIGAIQIGMPRGVA
ncbi:ADP-ribosyltransferase [Nocardia sp. NBC_00416]|uniref:ADP-ribosyltransferase n=1 Tax=Nocardia sp. NBC_00416 TaxID=2975991 RepID=UPI002E1C77DA